jgi:hypothetical protein
LPPVCHGQHAGSITADMAVELRCGWLLRNAGSARRSRVAMGLLASARPVSVAAGRVTTIGRLIEALTSDFGERLASETAFAAAWIVKEILTGQLL